MVHMPLSCDARLHQAGWNLGMCTIGGRTQLLLLASTRCGPMPLRISCEGGNLGTM